MELRPFRSICYSPAVISQRGLAALIAQTRGETAGAAPENIEAIIRADGATAKETLARWLAGRTLLKERRPGLWIYRQSAPEKERPAVLSFLVGLVRVAGGESAIEVAEKGSASPALGERLAFRSETKADFEPCLLSSRAPLSGALATNRRPDFSTTDARGTRHDGFRVVDFAQHVQLQGLVKDARAKVLSGGDLYEAARAFANDPAAAKLSSARFKLCAIGEESALGNGALPEIPAGLFGVSLEDPIY